MHPAQISSEEIKRDMKYFRCMKILQNMSILLVLSVHCNTSTEHKSCVQHRDYSKDNILEGFLDEENDGGEEGKHVTNCR